LKFLNCHRIKKHAYKLQKYCTADFNWISFCGVNITESTSRNSCGYKVNGNNVLRSKIICAYFLSTSHPRVLIICLNAHDYLHTS
jgi:hypothetical protein